MCQEVGRPWSLWRGLLVQNEPSSERPGLSTFFAVSERDPRHMSPPLASPIASGLLLTSRSPQKRRNMSLDNMEVIVLDDRLWVDSQDGIAVRLTPIHVEGADAQPQLLEFVQHGCDLVGA